MKNQIIILVCLMCLLFVGCEIRPIYTLTLGNTYYVATTGNDINPGTLAQPWLTPQHAIDTAIAGDTVYFIAGTYTTAHLVFANSGSAVGGYITFQNYAGGIVNININDSNYSGVETNGKNYLKIIGIIFTGYHGSGNTFYGIYILRSNHILIQNCTVTNTYSSGIYSEDSSYVTIDACHLYAVSNIWGGEECMSIVTTDHFEIKNCIIHDPGSAQRCGIDMKEGCTNGSVHHNEVYNLSGLYPTGIYIDASGSDSYNIDIYNNLVHDIPQGYGIEVGSEVGDTISIHDINIYNNIVYNCKLGGFVLTHRNSQTFTNIYFINNTLYSNSFGAGYPEIYFAGNTTYVSNCIIRNNIVYGTVYQSLPIYDPSGCYAAGKLVADHNLFYNSSGLWSMYLSTFGSNYIEANPLFVNVGTDFHIQSGSPAKDAGSATRAPATDYIGTARPQGAGVDIGAYEQLGSTSLAITTSSLPNGTVGTAYSQNLTAAGGTIPYTWTIASGTLPAGLSLSSGGVISGTPTTAGGPTSITFKVTDGTSTTAPKNFIDCRILCGL